MCVQQNTLKFLFSLKYTFLRADIFSIQAHGIDTISPAISAVLR